MLWEKLNQELVKIASSIEEIKEEMEEVLGGRKWDGDSTGYGKEHSSKKLQENAKWEPASKGPGRNEKDCKGYRQGGTEECYNKKETKGLGSTRNRKQYNKKYRQKRWPKVYK